MDLYYKIPAQPLENMHPRSVQIVADVVRTLRVANDNRITIREKITAEQIRRKYGDMSRFSRIWKEVGDYFEASSLFYVALTSWDDPKKDAFFVKFELEFKPEFRLDGGVSHE